jgi:membrane associated rhomboid family serine protease
MDNLAILALAVIIGSIVLSVWKKYSFCAVTAVACAIVFGLSLAENGLAWLAFMPRDLTDPGMIYTVLTSMYTHLGLNHLLFNMVGLAFIGIVLEQRIGTRPFIMLYLVSGLFGTLAFAGSYWNSPFASVVGASGAVSGVLGGLARLYPNERMAFIFFPTYPMKIWTIVLLFVGLQFLTVFFWSDIAWQAHLGGLVAGILVAPLVVKLRHEVATRKSIPVAALRKLAVTPELKGILGRIEQESVPDVKEVWIEHFMEKARCPICGSSIKVSGDAVRCSKGHLL